MIERALDHMSSFVRVVTFNGTAFDLPVLRYRAMSHALSFPRLARMNPFHRYGPTHVDLCDHLSSFSFSAKATLDDICKACHLPGKGSVSGAMVETLAAEGRFDEIAGYVQQDVVNTLLLFLRYGLFRGDLNPEEHRLSQRQIEADLRRMIDKRRYLAPFLEAAAADLPMSYSL